MSDQSQYLGVGFYSYADAARIIGIPSAKLRRWVRDYDHYTHAGIIERRALIVHHYGPQDRVLSFLELIELLFISLFRREGLSLKAIREAAVTAARWYATDYPFAIKRFSTDGRHIFATMANGANARDLLAELGRGQFALPTVIDPFLRKIEYSGDELAKAFWPLGRDQRIVLDPDRAFGQPIDAETGVPTDILYRAFKAEGENSIQRVANWYEVPVEAVEAAIAFEHTLSAA